MSDNETTLRETALTTYQEANQIIVNDNRDYESAGWLRREIKSAQKKITDYWKPLKDAAYAQHKALVAREAEMLNPLKEADKIVESRMLDYYREQERIRREAEQERLRQEAEARRAAEEAARLLEEASQSEDGEIDEDTAEILSIAQTQAEEAAAAVEPVYVPSAPKAVGMAVKHVWRARVVKEYLVPIAVAGVEIRPIDLKLLNKLATISQGKVECPGVEFYQEEQTAVRL